MMHWHLFVLHCHNSCAGDGDDAYDVSAAVESAKQLKHSMKADVSSSPRYDMIKGCLNDPTTTFAALREYTREDPSKNMLRALAKTLMSDTAWTIDMGDAMVPTEAYQPTPSVD